MDVFYYSYDAIDDINSLQHIANCPTTYSTNLNSRYELSFDPSITEVAIADLNIHKSHMYAWFKDRDCASNTCGVMSIEDTYSSCYLPLSSNYRHLDLHLMFVYLKLKVTYNDRNLQSCQDHDWPEVPCNVTKYDNVVKMIKHYKSVKMGEYYESDGRIYRMQNVCPTRCTCTLGYRTIKSKCDDGKQVSSLLVYSKQRIQVLNMRYVKISEIDEDALYINSFSNLKELLLYGNNISELPKNVFKGLTKLMILDIGYNQLSTLQNGIFTDMRFLTDLYLDQNKLIDLPTRIFHGLSRLEYLYLSHNMLTTLSTDIFISLRKVTVLELHNNQISHIESDVFLELNQLEELILNNNSFPFLNENSFVLRNPSLHSLLLFNNLISNISRNVFRHVAALELLDLSNNLLQSVDTN